MLRFLKFRPQNPFFATSDRNSQSCLFCQKIDTHGISRMLNFIPTLVFWISNPKSIFGETWAKENKVVSFVWKLAHTVSWEYRFLFQHQFSDIRNLSLENADFYSDISFLKFQTKSFFFWQIWVEKVKFSTFPGTWNTEYPEDVIARIPRKVWKRRYK